MWESYKLDQYVQRLAELVHSFQERVEDLLVVEEQLDVDVRSLETCPYSANTLADILSKVQHAIDDLSLRQYSNLHIWVNRLDQEVFYGTLLSFAFKKYIFWAKLNFTFKIKKEMRYKSIGKGLHCWPLHNELV